MNRPTNEVLGRLAFLANTRGIIPDPIDATRITETNGANGAETAIIYTVPASKILFISSIWMASRESVAAAGYCKIFTRTAADVTDKNLIYHYYDLAGHQVSSLPYFPAIEIPALYDVCVLSFHANIDALAGFSGWLESV